VPAGIKYEVVNVLRPDQALGGMVMLMLPGITCTHVTLELGDGTRLRYALDMKDEPEPHEREMFGLPRELPPPADEPFTGTIHLPSDPSPTRCRAADE
jgi:hypothetical protein